MISVTFLPANDSAADCAPAGAAETAATTSASPNLIIALRISDLNAYSPLSLSRCEISFYTRQPPGAQKKWP